MIIADTLAMKKVNRTTVLDLLKYYTKRGYVAYGSHRKRAVKEARKLGINVAL